MNTMNKFAHGVVLAFFGAACFLVWGLLQLPAMVRVHGASVQLPAFTRFCVDVGPIVVIGLAALATGYCLWVWFKKLDRPRSWVGFLATGTASLFFLTLVVLVAMYLPLVAALQSLPVK
jgi:hypothetical protein